MIGLVVIRNRNPNQYGCALFPNFVGIFTVAYY